MTAYAEILYESRWRGGGDHVAPAAAIHAA